MGGLTSVIRAANVLNGERNAPELPIPNSAIEAYADRYKMSGTFVQLVREYDLSVISGALKRRDNGAGTSGNQATKKLL